MSDWEALTEKLAIAEPVAGGSPGKGSEYLVAPRVTGASAGSARLPGVARQGAPPDTSTPLCVPVGHLQGIISKQATPPRWVPVASAGVPLRSAQVPARRGDSHTGGGGAHGLRVLAASWGAPLLLRAPASAEGRCCLQTPFASAPLCAQQHGPRPRSQGGARTPCPMRSPPIQDGPREALSRWEGTPLLGAGPGPGGARGPFLPGGDSKHAPGVCAHQAFLVPLGTVCVSGPGMVSIALPGHTCLRTCPR